MQRPIKFRAWMSDIKEMTYDLAFEDYEPINDLLEGVEHLMQYTGLKDKNGVEIYEGDVVKWRYLNNDLVNLVTYSDACFMVGSSHPVALIDLLSFDRQIEVIGNIWENPNLLGAEGEHGGEG